MYAGTLISKTNMIRRVYMSVELGRDNVWERRRGGWREGLREG